jgi:hypothetical protein
MIRNPNLDLPSRPARKDRRVHHDWRQPAAAIDELEHRIEGARDELVNDLHRTSKRLGCSHYSVGAPDDPLSLIFGTYDDKIEQAFGAFRRSFR